MTNQYIIYKESQRLLKEGKLKATGRVFTFTLTNGEKVEVQETEPIHTFAAWKELGYKVKKGEHAIAKFSIWKYSSKKTENENGEEVENGRCWLKESHFFSQSQVEAIV